MDDKCELGPGGGPWGPVAHLLPHWVQNWKFNSWPPTLSDGASKWPISLSLSPLLPCPVCAWGPCHLWHSRAAEFQMPLGGFVEILGHTLGASLTHQWSSWSPGITGIQAKGQGGPSWGLPPAPFKSPGMTIWTTHWAMESTEICALSSRDQKSKIRVLQGCAHAGSHRRGSFWPLPASGCSRGPLLVATSPQSLPSSSHGFSPTCLCPNLGRG